MSNSIMVEERVRFPVSEATLPLFIGMNFGGTHLKIGIIDEEGRTVSYFATPHHAELGPEESTRHAARAVLEAIDKTGTDLKSIVSAGFSFPGSLNPRTEQLHRPPNIPDWQGYPIAEKLAEYTGLSSVLFCNNANAAAYGEYWIGAAKGTHSVCLLLLDRGIGCGIIVEGREIKGANGFGGEFGHMIVDPSPGARWCNCLQQGHLEAYSSATAVARRTRELIEVGLSSSLKIQPDTPLDVIPRMVYEEAEKGDELATQIILDTARFLGLGIVTLLHTIDPECVLIGGEMMFGGKGSKIGEMFLARIREEIDKRALKDLAENLKLDFAQLGSFASYIGAAGLAREESLLLSVADE
ncbi:MAG: ROK family protein [Planctomycetaceae bacterium]|jgi:glucokinase|nr:ROK family protein [Planctomycetaceae bacterium]